MMARSNRSKVLLVEAADPFSQLAFGNGSDLIDHQARDAVAVHCAQIGATGKRNSGASVRSVVKAQIVIEAVASKRSLLDDDSWARLAGITLGRNRSKFHLVSCLAEVRNGIDKRLILVLSRTARHGKRLSMRFKAELCGPRVRNPNLHGSQAPRAHTLTVALHPLSNSLVRHFFDRRCLATSYM